MEYYLSRIGSHSRPAGAEDGQWWTGVRLMPSEYTVLALPTRSDGSRRIYLGNDAQSPSPAVRRMLSRHLHLNLESRSLGRLLLELLLNGSYDGKRWKPLLPVGNRYEVWLGNEIVATMPCLRGGVTLTFLDNFNRADETPLGTGYVGHNQGSSIGKPNLFTQQLECADVTPGSVRIAVYVGKSFADDQSSTISIVTTLRAPQNPVNRRCGFGVHIRTNYDPASSALASGGYAGGHGTPNTSSYNLYLNDAAIFGTSGSPNPNPPDPPFPGRLAEYNYNLGTVIPASGDAVTLRGVGSTITITSTIADSSGSPPFIGVTDTAHTSGYPGFWGVGNLSFAPGNDQGWANLDNFSADGQLDPGDPEFIDP